jgi:hypothetical protein
MRKKSGLEKKLVAILLGKKLLTVNYAVDEVAPDRMSIKGVLTAAKENPRLLEPAIVLITKYPTTVTGPTPDGLTQTVNALRKGALSGPNYKFAQYKKLYSLCKIAAKIDKRLNDPCDVRIRKNFRLEKESVEKLTKLKKVLGLDTETEVVQYLINKAVG